MCGIAGVYAPDSLRLGADHQAACERMLSALQHRGPDAEGLYAGPQIVLGHKRLAIIDLSEAAKQPLANEDESIWLSFNGEIYNYRALRDDLISKGHRFKSGTDSEVIVHLYEEYGTACLEQLEGMFAFALWDGNKRRLFLARDRFGIKPLYFVDGPSALVFASEVRAILASGLVSSEINSEALIHFLQFGSVPSRLTTFKSIRMLPAGHYLVRDGSGSSIRPYWDLARSFRADHSRPLDLELLRERFRQTLKRHLASDVPLGILLSGGMDSSSLVALARENADREIHTLTVAFEESELNESYFANLVSKHFGTQQHECLVTADQVLELIPSFLEAMDQPTSDGLNTFVVTKAAKDAGLPVVLSGVGGDELFGGYPYFKKIPWFFRMLPVLAHLPDRARSAVVTGLACAASSCGLWGGGRLDYLKEDPSITNAYRVYRGLFPPAVIQKLLDREIHQIHSDDEINLSGVSNHLDQATFLDFRYYLHDQLLRDGDVMSMAHSVELRVPFLDHQLVEAVLSIPASTRFQRNRSKFLLKEIVRSVLPEPILDRPKQGFVFPIDHWIRTRLRSKVEDVLLGGDWSELGFSLNQKSIQGLWSQFLSGRVHWSQPWALFILKRWLGRPHNFATMSSSARLSP